MPWTHFVKYISTLYLGSGRNRRNQSRFARVGRHGCRQRVSPRSARSRAEERRDSDVPNPFVDWRCPPLGRLVHGHPVAPYAVSSDPSVISGIHPRRIAFSVVSVTARAVAHLVAIERALAARAGPSRRDIWPQAPDRHRRSAHAGRAQRAYQGYHHIVRTTLRSRGRGHLCRRYGRQGRTLRRGTPRHPWSDGRPARQDARRSALLQ